MTISISIVIPSYKSTAYLEATLESVARQTYSMDNLELLVVDDASPDDSVDVARRLLERHSLNGRVIAREVNAGAGATRNFGWRMASGEWIQFLDQDDVLAPHKLELQAEIASRSEGSVAVIYSSWQHLSMLDGQWKPSGPVNAPVVDTDPLLQILQQQEFGYVGPTLIRKSFLSAVGGFIEQPNLGEDLDLMLRIAMAGGQFRRARSEEPAFFYRQRPNSLWQVYMRNPNAMRNLLQSINNTEKFLRERSGGEGLSEAVRIALARRYSRFARIYLENDAKSFQWIMDLLNGLGFSRPTDLDRLTRILSIVMGYKNAMKLQALYRN